MKLLLDENLPPRLADVLQSEFSGSTHVHSCGLGSADDEAIWEYARREGFTIVSKDSDFQERSVLCGHLVAHSKFIDERDRSMDSWRSSRNSGIHRRSSRDAASFEPPLASLA